MNDMTNPSDDISTILIEQSDRLFERRLTDDLFRRAEAGEWSPDDWGALQEAGLALTLVPEDAGGIGLEPAAAARLMRRLGYHACPLPVGETMIAAAAWTMAGGDLPDDQPMAIVPAGTIAAVRTDGGVNLTGQAQDIAADHAAHLLVEAELEGEPALFLVEASKVTLAPGRNLAGEPRMALSLDRLALPAEAVRRPASGQPSLRQLGAFLRAQQMVGGIERTLRSAVAHASDRKQFGRTLSQFQAIQHLLAEAEGHQAAARAAGDFAASAFATETFDFAVAVAKARIGEAAGKVAAISHQVHGAMGFTREHGLHRYTRRLWSWRDEFGNDAVWQQELGRLAFSLGGSGLWPYLVSEQERVLSRRAVG